MHNVSVVLVNTALSACNCKDEVLSYTTLTIVIIREGQPSEKATALMPIIRPLYKPLEPRTESGNVSYFSTSNLNAEPA